MLGRVLSLEQGVEGNSALSRVDAGPDFFFELAWNARTQAQVKMSIVALVLQLEKSGNIAMCSRSLVFNLASSPNAEQNEQTTCIGRSVFSGVSRANKPTLLVDQQHKGS